MISQGRVLSCKTNDLLIMIKLPGKARKRLVFLVHNGQHHVAPKPDSRCRPTKCNLHRFIRLVAPNTKKSQKKLESQSPELGVLIWPSGRRAIWPFGSQIGKQIGEQSAKLFDANSGHIRKRGGHGEAVDCVVFQNPLLNIRDQAFCLRFPPRVVINTKPSSWAPSSP